MPIPIIKAGMVVLRLTLRPINNIMLKKFKSYDKETYAFKFFSNFGQRINVFEIKLNRVLLGTKGLSEIKPIHESKAFH